MKTLCPKTVLSLHFRNKKKYSYVLVYPGRIDCFSPAKLHMGGLPQINVTEQHISKAYLIPDKSYQYDAIWNKIQDWFDAHSAVHRNIISIVKPTWGTNVSIFSLLASKQTAVFVAVRTVLNSWWWTERPSETCRVSFYKIK